MLWKLPLPEHSAEDLTSCRLDQVAMTLNGLSQALQNTVL